MGVNPYGDSNIRWIVCFSVWCTEFIVMGLFFSFGTIFVALVTDLDAAESLAAWIGSLALSMCHISSFVVRLLSQHVRYQIISCFGGLLLALGLLLSSFTQQVYGLVITYGIIVGLGCGLARFSAIFALPWYFNKHRSLAMGVALSGYGFGAVTIGYITEVLISKYGIFTTFRILSCFGVLILFGSVAYRPVATESQSEAPIDPKTTRTFYSLFKNKQIMFHCIAFWLYCFGLYVPNVHLVYMAETANVPPYMATFLPSILAVSQSLGRLVFGQLTSTERIDPVKGCQVTMFVCSLATTLCPLSKSFAGFLGFAVVFGFFDSCSTIMALKIIEEILGTNGLSSGYSLQMTGSAVSVAIGPAAAGFIYESTRSYTIPFIVSGGLQTICVCILFLVGKGKRIELDISTKSLCNDDDQTTSNDSHDSGIVFDHKPKIAGQNGKSSVSETSDFSSRFHSKAESNPELLNLLSSFDTRGPFNCKIPDNTVVMIERETVL